jgi:hypothetical protein
MRHETTKRFHAFHIVRCTCVATTHKIFDKMLVYNDYVKTNTINIIGLNISQFFDNNQCITKLIQIKLLYNTNIRENKV